MQVDPIKLVLKAPVFKSLKLKSDEALSNLAFRFNLRHHTKDGKGIGDKAAAAKGKGKGAAAAAARAAEAAAAAATAAGLAREAAWDRADNDDAAGGGGGGGGGGEGQEQEVVGALVVQALQLELDMRGEVIETVLSCLELWDMKAIARRCNAATAAATAAAAAVAAAEAAAAMAAAGLSVDDFDDDGGAQGTGGTGRGLHSFTFSST